MYTTIIFDFFGIFHTDTTKEWINKNGFTKREKFKEASWRLDHGKISMHDYYEELSQLSDIPAVEIEEDFQKMSQIDHDMVSFLKNLHKKYTMGLLSNAPSDYLRNILFKYQLDSLFDVVVISGEVRLAKPEPKIFLHILEKLETAAAETIFIDDNEINIKAAETIGIKGIHYHDLKTLQEDLKRIGMTV